MHIKARTCPTSFEGRVARFTGEGGDAELFGVLRFGEREGGPAFAFAGGEGNDGIVEAGELDFAIRVFHRVEEVSQGQARIGDRSAEATGVEIGFGAMDAKFIVGDAAEAVGDGGLTGAVLARVGNDDDVGGQLLLERWQEFCEDGATAFFLTLDEEFDLERQWLLGLVPSGGRKDMGQHLAFVVGGATGDDIAIFEDGFEGRAVPQVERIRGLNIVVSVDEDHGFSGDGGGFGIDQGWAVAGDEFGAEASLS